MTRAFFISDVHLRSMSEPNAQTLLAFVTRLSEAPRATHLFLVGDIFDLWIGSHHVFVDEYRPIARALAAAVASGVEVHFFEGNHDLYLADFWQGEIGARVHRDAASFRVAGLDLRVEHGDLINLEDRGYLALRRTLRSAPIEWLATRLPDAAVSAIGKRASRASRRYTSGSKRRDPEQIREMIRAHAVRAFAEKPFDLIVSGHVHVTDDFRFEVAGRSVRSINLGWWADGPIALQLDDQDTRFIKLV